MACGTDFGVSFTLFVTHLIFAITGENADPFVVIVRNDDVTTGVHGNASGALKLPWRPAPHTKATPELPIV